MAFLLANGFNLGAVIAASEPKGDRRIIGNAAAANDGTMRVTRQSTKRDLSFTTVPLSDPDAFVWESFFTGEGETWSFDSSVYGSKGLGPTGGGGYSIVAGGAKFGASKLRLVAGGVLALVGAGQHSSGRADAGSPVSYAVWRFESAAWHHYVIRSDGAKWVDGVRNDAAATTWAIVSLVSLGLANIAGGNEDYDDLTSWPFLIPTTWPAILAAATSAYCPQPYLDLSGDQVPELLTRRTLATVSDTLSKTATGTRHKLAVDFRAK